MAESILAADGQHEEVSQFLSGIGAHLHDHKLVIEQGHRALRTCLKGEGALCIINMWISIALAHMGLDEDSGMELKCAQAAAYKASECLLVAQEQGLHDRSTKTRLQLLCVLVDPGQGSHLHLLVTK